MHYSQAFYREHYRQPDLILFRWRWVGYEVLPPHPPSCSFSKKEYENNFGTSPPKLRRLAFLMGLFFITSSLAIENVPA